MEALAPSRRGAPTHRPASDQPLTFTPLVRTSLLRPLARRGGGRRRKSRSPPLIPSHSWPLLGRSGVCGVVAPCSRHSLSRTRQYRDRVSTRRLPFHQRLAVGECSDNNEFIYPICDCKENVCESAIASSGGVINVPETSPGHVNHASIDNLVINVAHVAEWAACESETSSQAETEETVCYLPVTEETNCIQRPGSFETSTALTINTLSGDSETIKDNSESRNPVLTGLSLPLFLRPLRESLICPAHKLAGDPQVCSAVYVNQDTATGSGACNEVSSAYVAKTTEKY